MMQRWKHQTVSRLAALAVALLLGDAACGGNPFAPEKTTPDTVWCFQSVPTTWP